MHFEATDVNVKRTYLYCLSIFTTRPAILLTLHIKKEMVGRPHFVLNEARNKTVLGVFRNVNQKCLLTIKVANY